MNFSTFFGPEAADYMILLFTHISSNSKRSLPSLLKTAPENLQGLVEKCQNRVFGIENKTDDMSEKRMQMDTILAGIESLITENGGEFYTNKMYKENLRRLKEGQDKIVKEFEERQEKLIEAIEKKIKEKYEKAIENYQNEMQRKMKEEVARELANLKLEQSSQRMADQENIKLRLEKEIQQKYDQRLEEYKDVLRDEVKQELKRKMDTLKTKEEAKIKNVWTSQRNQAEETVNGKIFNLYW